MEDIVVLIPTYNPNINIMQKFIDELLIDFKNVVIVNDGSGKEFDNFFKELQKLNITVVSHDVNLGKGQAIKTGFEYILKNFPNIIGTVTADCDGQHSVLDIKKCAISLRENPNSLIVGCRNFKEPQTPPRSKFGNNLTKFVFMIFIGVKISDTQSGLRAFSPHLMRKFLDVKGKRYEYETNILIECKNSNIPIQEVPIQTIYIHKNETSHFNPIKDSLMIYKLFFKYALTAISSFAMDMLLFCIFINLIKTNYNIMISTVLARILSSIYNFMINSKYVFKKSNKSSLIKYFLLVLIQMLISGISVTFFADYLHLNAPITKLLIDTIIFIVNFIIQREIIFKNEENDIELKKNKKKVLVIHNPSSGTLKNKIYFKIKIKKLKNKNYDLFFKSTTPNFGAEEIITNENSFYDFICVCGGDGTLNQVITAFSKNKEKKKPIIYVPLGTTNDFARSLKIKKFPSNISKFDTGIINNNYYFNYIVASGLFTETSYNTSRIAKKIFGRLAYFYNGLKELFSIKEYKTKVYINNKIIDDKFIYIAVSNSYSIGGFKIFKKNELNLDDGIFELLLVKKPKNLYKLVLTAIKILFKNHNDENIIFMQSDKIKIITEEKINWTFDGEKSNKYNELNINNLNKNIEFLIL